MGKHDGKDHGEDDRPPAKSGEDLCEEYGHGSNIHYGEPKEDPRDPGAWYAKWECRRCRGHGVNKVEKP